MTDSSLPSLLITPDTRRRLQEQYQEAMRLAGREPADFARIHEMLAECVRTDPGSILYLEALLANLRQWGPRRRRSWLPDWLAGRQPGNQKVQSTEDEVLRTAPETLLENWNDHTLLGGLAEAAGACDLDEVELHYWIEARNIAPDDAPTQRQLARALTRQGRFEEAVGPWFAVLALDPDAEAKQAAEDLKHAALSDEYAAARLVPTEGIAPNEGERLLELARSLRAQGILDVAGYYLDCAQHAAGGDLRILAEREELRLAYSNKRLEIARLRAASDPHPKAQALVGRMEQEHNRLEIDIFHLRSERHSDDLSLRWELARRLKRAGNYSGAIQRLEEARADPRLAAEVNLELGECWQHLRQFPKAIEFYRLAVIEPGGDHRTTLTSALYRLGVLAAAMDLPREARDAFSRLLSIEPEYKDARERLDKLP